MAGTVTISQSIKVTNGDYSFPRYSKNKTIVQDALGGPVPGTVSIGTSEEDVDLSELTTEGWIYLENLDDANFIQWGAKDGSGNMQEIGRLEAGESAQFRMEPGATLRMKADTAACQVLILCFED